MCMLLIQSLTFIRELRCQIFIRYTMYIRYMRSVPIKINNSHQEVAEIFRDEDRCLATVTAGNRPGPRGDSSEGVTHYRYLLILLTCRYRVTRMMPSSICCRHCLTCTSPRMRSSCLSRRLWCTDTCRKCYSQAHRYLHTAHHYSGTSGEKGYSS